MFKRAYEKFRGVFRNHRGRAALRSKSPRRLSLESLECRKLLTVTTLTLNSISDGNFAAPALAANAFQVNPTSSPWSISGDAGVSANNSGFTVGNPKSPDGAQVGFIKNNATMSQTVYLETGVYNLSFLAAQRVNYQTQNQEIEVLIDGADVGNITPASTTYAEYQSTNFTVTSGTHTVELLGLSPQNSDSTAFLDDVAITPAVDSLLDGGFEQPALPLATMSTDTNGTPWQFTGTAGIASNGVSSQAQNAPSGTQVGFVQDTGSMTQEVYLDAGIWQLTFQAAQDTTDQSNYQEIEVLVDGTPYGTIDPTGSSYATYQSSTFSVAAGAHSIELLGVNPLGGTNTAFLDQVTLSQGNALSDGNFATPQLNAGTYQFAPTGSDWTFSGGGGIASNASTFTTGNPAAPDGTQVAILQGNGSMSQSVSLPAGSYNISFQAAQCSTNTANESQQIEVLVNGAEVGLVTPVGTSYGLYQTLNFPVSGASQTIEFEGTNPQGGNNTALVGLVSVGQAQDEIIDGSFASPVLPSNSSLATPSGTPWQFAGTAGISTNGSGLTGNNPSAPGGTQVGYITNQGSMTYTLDLDANTYNFSFMAAQRAGQATSQQLKVLVDGAAVASFTPSGTAYTQYDTANFSVAAGVHSIEILGMSTTSGASTVFLDQVTLATAENSLTDGGFEAPVLSAKAFLGQPGGAGWQFTGNSGVTTNNSGFTAGTANAPGGSQAAYLKDNATISQPVYFDAGTYNISFQATQRYEYQTQNQQIEVLVGGMIVGVFTPASSITTATSTFTNTSYTPCQTSNFTLAAGTYTVEFLGLAPASADSTAFIDNAAINTGSALVDGSFEQPALAAKAYVIAPTGTGWQFTGDSGISANSSAFTYGNPAAPNGNQVAFLKDTATISQSTYLAGGVYNVSFLAAQRDEYQSSYETIEILVDGQVVGTVTPSNPASGNYAAGTTYGQYETSNFTVTSGMHTIEFLGVNPTGKDNTAFIDNVQLNA